MLIKRMEVGSFAANCYLVACEQTREGILIDPGAEGKNILAWIEKEKVSVKYIINTHGHIDHVGANEGVRRALGVPLMIHAEDSHMLANPDMSLARFLGSITPSKPDQTLKDGDLLRAGTLSFKVLETPGHSRGSITLWTDGALFTGDTLFAGSIGRTDFPGGSHPQIIRSIKEKLLVFPEETAVYPGHGPQSTIGEEKKYNPFLR